MRLFASAIDRLLQRFRGRRRIIPAGGRIDPPPACSARSTVYDNADDCAALLAAGSAMGVWAGLRGTSPCGWPGVGCDGATGRVTSVRLAGLGLAGSLPAALGNLTQLSLLDLSGNGFSGVIPDAFGAAQQLSTLLLTGNSLGGVCPPSLRALPLLANVSLRGNALCAFGDNAAECAVLQSLAADWDLWGSDSLWNASAIGGSPLCGGNATAATAASDGALTSSGGLPPWPGITCSATDSRVSGGAPKIATMCVAARRASLSPKP